MSLPKSINVTLTNVSSTSVVVKTILTSDPAVSSLPLNGACGFPIPAGGSCTAAVPFTPTAAQSYSATITLSGVTCSGCSVPYPDQTLAVTGTGVVVAPPVFSPAGGTFTSKQSVTLTDASPGSIIYFTIDGSTPTASSATYALPIQVASTGLALEADFSFASELF